MSRLRNPGPRQAEPESCSSVGEGIHSVFHSGVGDDAALADEQRLVHPGVALVGRLQAGGCEEIWRPRAQQCDRPGRFWTDISKGWTEGFRAEIDRIVTMRRAGEAHEIVGAALYLASDAASYTSGAVIKVDGGFAYG